MDAVGNIKIAALRFLRGDQCLDSIIEQTDPREALSTLEGREAHAVALAQVTGFCKCLSQGSHQHGLVLYGGIPVSYTHLRAHETRHDLVCRLLLEKKKK